MNDWLQESLPGLNESAMAEAGQRQKMLTKPPGSLGRLEAIAIQMAGIQGQTCPNADSAQITVFAGDHGVAAQGVSAFPQAVTAEMVRNFARGGAAISAAARALETPLEVVNLGTVSELEPLEGVLALNLGPGTDDFTQGSAMSDEQLVAALDAGRDAVDRAKQAGATVFIGGEMGIANTTAASALCAALLNLPGAGLAGPGTGLDEDGVKHKAEVIDQALALHAEALGDPQEVLRRLGGFEIAALSGAYIRAAQTGMTVIVDGFIATAAALMAEKIKPGVKANMLFGHGSAEPKHGPILAMMAVKPLLNLDMRLGEASGAAMALPLVQMACRLHADMATFEQAGVSQS